MLPSNIAHEQKITSRRSFFKALKSILLEDFLMKVYKNKEEQRLVEEEERADRKREVS